MKALRRRSSFTLIELLVVIAIIGILATFLSSALGGARKKAEKAYCANNLKGIGIALILYADQHRFFPHMKPGNEEHSPEDISKVYRTLIYGKYIDNAEGYICPSSDDFALSLSDAVINNPKQFSWGSEQASGSNLKPILGGSDPSVFDNLQLSYSYVKRRLKASTTRSDTILAADKGVREDSDVADSGLQTDAPLGCHSDGFNVLYADGHVAFALTSEGRLMERLKSRLVLPDSFDPQRFSGDQ